MHNILLWEDHLLTFFGFLILTLYFQSTFLLLPHSTHVSLYLSHFRLGAFLRLSCSNSPSHTLIYQMELTFSFPLPNSLSWWMVYYSSKLKTFLTPHILSVHHPSCPFYPLHSYYFYLCWNPYNFWPGLLHWNSFFLKSLC